MPSTSGLGDPAITGVGVPQSHVVAADPRAPTVDDRKHVKEELVNGAIAGGAASAYAPVAAAAVIPLALVRLHLPLLRNLLRDVWFAHTSAPE